MKAGIYEVKGTNGPGKTEPVIAQVTQDAGRAGRWVASFKWHDVAWLYGERPLSPHPERIEPKRASVNTQPVAASIARAAFRAAFSASVHPVAIDESETFDVDDAFAMKAMRERSAGPREGRYTRSAR